MNYLTLALQLLTMYALYRLWTNVRKLSAKPDKDLTESKPKAVYVQYTENGEIKERLDEYFKEGNELANVKLEPKEKSAPPPPAGQLQIDLEPKKTRTYGRTIYSLSDSEIRFLLFRLRQYSEEKRKHTQGEAKRPHVSEVFPLVGSNLKVLLTPALMTEEDYQNWKRYGRWAAVMKRTDEDVIKHIRK